jgi:protein tyrosine phosphatase (PTP) superfamily phosphohydrolase (DUF442 family)
MCGNPAFDSGRPVPPPPPPPPPPHHHQHPDHANSDSPPPVRPHHNHPPPAPPPPDPAPETVTPPQPPAPPPAPFKPLPPQYVPAGAPEPASSNNIPSPSDTETARQRATGSEWKGPSVVGWSYSIDDAKRLARANNAGFAVYFCSELTARTAGEGTKATAEFKLANNGAAPEATIFESTEVLSEFNNAGISTFAKIPMTKENAALAQSFGAETNTLVICAPNGEKLWSCSGGQCTASTVVQFLSRDFASKFAQWQKARSGANIGLPQKPSGVGVEKLNEPHLPNAYRFSSRLISGGPPQGEAGFQALRSLGVKTIISVDGAPPETAPADALNIACVHLPIPYREVPKDRALEIAKALRDLPGPVYLHCSNGTARAPAAAGVVSVMLGEMSPQDACDALKSIGVLPGYSGLYASVLNATKVGKEPLDALNVNFTARAPITPLIQSMVAMEKVWSRIEMAQQLEWTIPESRKDLKPEEDMLQLIDCLIDAGKLDEIATDTKKQAILADGEKWAAVLRRTWKKDAQTPHRSEELNAAFKGVLSSCYDCHTQYREK